MATSGAIHKTNGPIFASKTDKEETGQSRENAAIERFCDSNMRRRRAKQHGTIVATRFSKRVESQCSLHVYWTLCSSQLTRNRVRYPTCPGGKAGCLFAIFLPTSPPPVHVSVHTCGAHTRTCRSRRALNTDVANSAARLTLAASRGPGRHRRLDCLKPTRVDPN